MQKSYKCIKTVGTSFKEGNVYLFSYDESEGLPYVCERNDNGREHHFNEPVFNECFVPVNQPKPYCNPYSLALKAYQDIRLTQIQKGLEKYHQPLHPSNHSQEELFNHTMEELVDLTHYIAANHYKVHHVRLALNNLLHINDADLIKEGIQEVLNDIGETL